jgi:hypothetical protein
MKLGLSFQGTTTKRALQNKMKRNTLSPKLNEKNNEMVKIT